jgi:cell division protein FtsB
MQRKRLTVEALYQQVLALKRTTTQLKREVQTLSEKLDIEPKDAIGFRMEPVEDADDQDAE